MIDTDKYKGHTPADDWEKHLVDALFETEFPMTYQDNQLMADAPLLLEEVKRLREENRNRWVVIGELRQQLKEAQEDLADWLAGEHYKGDD